MVSTLIRLSIGLAVVGVLLVAAASQAQAYPVTNASLNMGAASMPWRTVLILPNGRVLLSHKANTDHPYFRRGFFQGYVHTPEWRVYIMDRNGRIVPYATIATPRSTY